MNKITLFSNGIGHFLREQAVAGEQKVSIPFNKNHIGDVAASIQVFGKVRYISPPAFAPSDADVSHLKIVKSHALSSLWSALSGAMVKIRSVRFKEGTELRLVGTEREIVVDDGGRIHRTIVVFQDSNGKFVKESEHNISEWEFVDDSVKAEIDKALKSNFHRIKPHSSFLEMTLAPIDEKVTTNAIISYTVPVAAWKMRYAIREEKGVFTLEGTAIVDNNTDEDWNNFNLSVVTGNPISFETDIANVISPVRKKISVMEGGEVSEVACANSARRAKYGSRNLESMNESVTLAAFNPKMSMANYASFGLAEDQELEAESMPLEGASAPGMDSKDVGDFCVFTSAAPVSIASNKSAIVPMFVVPLKTASTVLLYSQRANSTRPYRAIKFKNDSPHSLGRGKVTIFHDNVFSGECILTGAKPNENRTLAHCLENGVKIIKKIDKNDSIKNAVILVDGLAKSESIQTAVTIYEVTNRKKEGFKFVLEHEHLLAKNESSKLYVEGVKDAETESFDGGTRIFFNLAAEQKLTIRVNESQNLHQEWRIGGRDWYVAVFDAEDKEVLENPQVKKSIDLQRQIDEETNSQNALTTRLIALKEQAKRIQETLTALKSNDNAEWASDARKTEDEIRALQNKSIPELNQKLLDLKRQLGQELQKISLSWKPKAK